MITWVRIFLLVSQLFLKMFLFICVYDFCFTFSGELTHEIDGDDYIVCYVAGGLTQYA